MSNGFYKNRRLKSFLFFAVCLLVSTFPHIFQFKDFLFLVITISFLVAFYGLNVISKNRQRSVFSQNNEKIISADKLPSLDILVAARDEENVIERLVERLFNLDLSLIHI